MSRNRNERRLILCLFIVSHCMLINLSSENGISVISYVKYGLYLIMLLVQHQHYVLLFISYDRYQMVSQGLNYISKTTIRRALKIVLGTWIIAALNYGRRKTKFD